MEKGMSILNLFLLQKQISTNYRKLSHKFNTMQFTMLWLGSGKFKRGRIGLNSRFGHGCILLGVLAFSSLQKLLVFLGS